MTFTRVASTIGLLVGVALLGACDRTPSTKGSGSQGKADADADEKLPYQEKADAAVWKWNPDLASVGHSAKQVKGYEVRITGPRIAVVDGDKEVCSFNGHPETVFTTVADVLCVADFHPISTGCELVAYDLKSGKQLWKCELRGIGPTSHSKYRNQVNLASEDGMVVVYGNESNGRYIEFVDVRLGKTVGHKRLPPEWLERQR
jgi:hypothetical protein